MSPVVLRCFPKADRVFARAVAAAVNNVRSAPEHPVPGPVQAYLRRTFPNAVVSPRDDLAALGIDVPPLWYVFRDGGIASQSHAPRRVLVMDDDDAFTEMLAAMLAQAGFDVRCARDGAEGFDVAATFEPNVILLDLGMPRVSGDEFARRYRDVGEGKAQIVVLSGLPDAWKRAQATDARAVLKKPFEMAALLQLVHHLA